jgi:hypothetical protein
VGVLTPIARVHTALRVLKDDNRLSITSVIRAGERTPDSVGSCGWGGFSSWVYIVSGSPRKPVVLPDILFARHNGTSHAGWAGVASRIDLPDTHCGFDYLRAAHFQGSSEPEAGTSNSDGRLGGPGPLCDQFWRIFRRGSGVARRGSDRRLHPYCIWVNLRGCLPGIAETPSAWRLG